MVQEATLCYMAKVSVKQINGIIPIIRTIGVIMAKARTFMYNGKMRTIREIAEANGLTRKILEVRVRKNNGVFDESLLKEKRKMDSLVGNIYGRLEVKEFSHTDDCGNTHWVCHCECGGVKTINRQNLLIGATKSCGCIAVEKVRERSTTHGHTVGGVVSPTFKTWESMRYRCRDKSNKDYGAKGITVCDEWDSSFENFLKDMGERPIGTSLDRIDNTKGYSKDNCRWATSKEQNQNTSRSKYWFVNGKRYNSHKEAGKDNNMHEDTVLRKCLNNEEGFSCELKYPKGGA